MAGSPFAQSAEYCVDLVYPSSFVLGQTPLQMQWAAVAAGATAGPLTRPFSYCDLGCGDGSTLCLLAACYPEADFVGIDINPTHIELARDRAARASIGNVRFVHSSFGSLDGVDLPDLDYVAAYGVYSWLSPGLQASIGAFARQRLRPGGLLALHYSSLPGSAVRDPLSFYLKTLANAASGSSSERFASGLAALRKLAPFAGFFRQNPESHELLRSIDSAPPAYVAHDILNRRIHSFYADEIRARFAAPEFFFLGSAHVLPDYPELLLSRQAFAAWQQLVAGADASFREAARDFMLNTGLRFDLFRRSGQESRIRGERLQQLGELWLQRTEARDDIDSRRRWSAGCAVDLGGPLHSTILDLAAAPAITLGEILRSGELKGFAITDVELAIEHLFAIGLVNVLVRRPLETRYSGDRRYRLSSPLNALRLEESRSSSAAEGLASTVLGSPLLMPPAARLQLLAMLGNVPQPASDLAPQMLRLGIIEEER